MNEIKLYYKDGTETSIPMPEEVPNEDYNVTLKRYNMLQLFEILSGVQILIEKSNIYSDNDE